jgi:hypothetical protein
MTITLTFNSLDEFFDQIEAYAKRRIVVRPKAKPEEAPIADVVRVLEEEKAVDHAALNESAKATTEIINRAEAKEETPAPEPEPEITEDYRKEVRRVLYQLKQKSGDKEISMNLIKEFGVNGLSDVALKDLPALMAKAQEALNA